MSEELGVQTKRSEDFSKWYLEVVRKGGFIDQRSPAKGFDVIMPWGYAIWQLIQEKFNVLLKEDGTHNTYFPMVIPERLLKKEEDHLEGFKAETMMITDAGGEKLEEKLAVRPTSETIMYHMFNLWIRSHTDLPMKVNQWCNIVRYDTKMTKPFIRGREFLWSEGHTAHATEEGAKAQVDNVVKKMYQKMYDDFAMSKLLLERPKSDTFAGANFSVVFDTLMQDGKVVQGPGTHMLGQNFSKPFDIKFTDQDGKEKFVWQTSWGITTRQIGALIMHHGDDKGAVLPPEIAPYQVVIVPILFKGKEKMVEDKTKGIKKSLEEDGLRVHLDDRPQSAGFKFNEWELKGVPLRIEIGPKDVENEELTIVTRLGKKDVLKDIDKVKEILADIQKELSHRSEKFLLDSIKDVKTLEELKKRAEEGGFFRGNWCGSGECEGWIKSESGGAEVRGTLYGKEEKPFGNCIYCGKDAKHVVYMAKAY